MHIYTDFTSFGILNTFSINATLEFMYLILFSSLYQLKC